MQRRWGTAQNILLAIINKLWKTRKIRILKKWKKNPKMPEISSFYTCVPKIMIRWCMVSKVWCTTDGRTDRKKWHIEVGAPPKMKARLDLCLTEKYFIMHALRDNRLLNKKPQFINKCCNQNKLLLSDVKDSKNKRNVAIDRQL